MFLIHRPFTSTKSPQTCRGGAFQTCFPLLAHPPEHPLALEQVLQSQQSLLPLGPVGAGTVVQHLRHVLRLTQVVRRHAAVT